MIEFCLFYATTEHPNFRPACKSEQYHLQPGVRCLSSRPQCPSYTPSKAGNSIDTIILDEFAGYPTGPLPKVRTFPESDFQK